MARKPKSLWFWIWMAWLGAFAGLEAWAIIDQDPGDTLSETIWFLQGQWAGLTYGLAALFVFLIAHFIIDRRARGGD
jgi:hypothetical protein